MPGKIAVLSFSDTTVFCPGGQPINLGSSTNLRGALEFAKCADVPGVRFVVISDGQPDDAAGALKLAAQYHNRIDTIYVGPEGGYGQEFLARLASVKNGKSLVSAQAKELSSTVETLLLNAG